MEPRYLMVTTTIDTKEGAAKLAKSLVEKKLAACAQITGPIESVYWWEEKVESSEEWKVTLKITTRNYQEIEEAIKSLHPYDLPQIVATPISQGSADYLAWIEENSKG